MHTINKIIVSILFLLCISGCNIPNLVKDTIRWIDSNFKQVKNEIELGSDFELNSYFYIPEGVEASIIDNQVNINELGSYPLLLRISANGVSVEKEYKFTVIDTTPPEISMKNDNIFHPKGEEFIPGDYYTAYDKADGDLTNALVLISELDVNNVGTNPVEIAVKDSSGNETKYTGEITINVPLTTLEKLAVQAVKALTLVLKDPSSLQIHLMSGYELGDSHLFAIDYSAKNSLGGINRSTIIVEVETEKQSVNLAMLKDSTTQTVYKSMIWNSDWAVPVSVNKIMSYLDYEQAIINEQLNR